MQVSFHVISHLLIMLFPFIFEIISSFTLTILFHLYISCYLIVTDACLRLTSVLWLTLIFSKSSYLFCETRWHIKIICRLLITSFITYIFGNLRNHHNHISKFWIQNTQITAYTLRGRATGRNIMGMLKTLVGWTFWRFFFFFFGRFQDTFGMEFV